MKNQAQNLDPLVTQIQSRQAAVNHHEEHLRCQLFQNLQSWDRDGARQMFELLLQWNCLNQFLSDWKQKMKTDSSCPVFVADLAFLRELIKHLTPLKDESITYVTGPCLGTYRILAKMCDVEYADQSVIHAAGTPRSCSDTLIGINEMGLRLHVMAHSHPGSGPAATHESSTDIGYLSKVQAGGADVVGIIVTRDGYLRFFTVDKPFMVMLQGNGIKEVQDNVYKIPLE